MDLDGNKFQGFFFNGLLNGEGSIDYANGVHEEGLFADNVLNGKGKRVRSNSVEEGSFVKGRLVSGSMQLPDGTLIEAQEIDGTSFRGKGRVVLANGVIQEGNFEANKLNGFGKSVTQNYTDEGMFVDGLLSGQGSRTAVSGLRHEGTFVAGMMSFGKITYPDGSVYEGPVQNNKKVGDGVYTYAVDGSKYVGAFANDKPNGHGVLTFADGTIVEGNFSDGDVSGEAVIQYPNGIVYRGPVVSRRLRHGTGTVTSADGKTSVSATFDHDKTVVK